jgi:hypothetical protein
MLAVNTVNRACVIGAGAAGLTALHHLRKVGLDAILLEQNAHVGGMWKQSNENAIYDSLTTNLPKEIMGFSREHPFDSGSKSFLHHTNMHLYLEEFADRNNLWSDIKLSCSVTDVRKVANGAITADSAVSPTHWEVRFTNGSTNETEIITCDAVVVCNGHFNKPNVPTIPGQEHFRGDILHSQRYKNPVVYTGKNVLVVGAKSSGTDVARELRGISRSVHVSNRSYTGASFQSDLDIHFHPGIRCINENGRVIMANGEEVTIDTIILCTGYGYAFPFLSDATMPRVHAATAAATAAVGGAKRSGRDCGDILESHSGESFDFDHLTVEDRSVRPLYQHVFFIPDPTLSFIGLNQTIIPFPIFHLQAEWMAAVYGNRFGAKSLPTKSVMHAQRIADETTMKDPRNYHNLGPDMFDYMRFLAQEIGILSTSEGKVQFETWLRTVIEIYEDVGRRRPVEVGGSDSYRDKEYVIVR